VNIDAGAELNGALNWRWRFSCWWRGGRIEAKKREMIVAENWRRCEGTTTDGRSGSRTAHWVMIDWVRKQFSLVKFRGVYWIRILRDFKRFFNDAKVMRYSIKTICNLKKVLWYSIKTLCHFKKVLRYSIKTFHHFKKVLWYSKSFKFWRIV